MKRPLRDTVPNFEEPDTQVDAADTDRHLAAPTETANSLETWPNVSTLPFARGKRQRRGAQLPVRLDTRRHESSAPHHRPGVGRRYLNYEIRRRLARGAMGVVYEATHVHLDRRVAIKFLSPSLLSDAGIVYRFLGEARAMARIEHPGVPRVFDFGQDETGNAYLVMDYLDGDSLADRIDRDPPSLRESIALAAQVAEVLAAAHEQDIVHRDLKPENIILCGPREDTRVRLIDFGVCKAAWDTRDDTVAGNLIGTPRYMAPEQTTSEDITTKTDVYALGCILYELISGQPPFLGSIAELVESHRQRVPRDIRQLRRDTPSSVANLIKAMLAKQPGARPSSGAELVTSLRDALDRPLTRSPDSPRQSELEDPVVARPRRRPPPLPRAGTARSAIERGMLGPASTPIPFQPPVAMAPEGSIDIRSPGLFDPALVPALGGTTQLTIAQSRWALIALVVAVSVGFVLTMCAIL